MTTSTDVSQTTKQEASKVTDTASSQAKDVAATAKDATSDVVGTAREQAGQVASEAAGHVQNLLGQAKEAVGGESEELVQRLAHNIRRLAGDLANMADLKGTPGSPANAIVSEVSTRTSSLATLLESRGTEGLITEAQNYARRKPGMFLFGAAGVGLLAGRLTRAIKAGPPPATTSTAPTTTAVTTPATSTAEVLDPSIARP